MKQLLRHYVKILEDLDEPEAKASMIWIIGEYAERIDNADELLDSFLDSFADETAQVQLQLLTATVKLFLKQPDNAQEMVQRVLNQATEDSDNPDLRDRGYIYWRLLSSDPEAARAVVLSTKPDIGDDTFCLDPSLLEDLISQIATLSSIYHKPPESFVMKSVVNQTEDDDDDYYDEPDTSSGAYSPNTASSGGGSSSGGNNDLLDFMDDTPAPSASNNTNVQKVQFLAPDAGKGLGIMGAIVNQGGKISVEMDVTNTNNTPTQALAIQLNKNGWGLAPVSPQVPLSSAISNGSSCSCSIDLKIGAPQDGVEPGATIQAAIKNMATNEVCYFHMPVFAEALFVQGSGIDAPTFAGQWKSMGEANEVSVIVNNVPTTNTDDIKSLFARNNMEFIAARQIPNTDQTAVYFAAKTSYPNTIFLVETKFKAGANICKVTVKSGNNAHSDVVKSAVARVVGP